MNLSKSNIIVIISNSLIILVAVPLMISVHPSQSQLTEEFSNSQSNIINLDITNLTITNSPTGLISINGVVVNNSTENIQNIQVDITLYDADNNTIRETSRFISSAFYIFEPGLTEDFNFFMSAEDVNGYTLRAYANIVR